MKNTLFVFILSLATLGCGGTHPPPISDADLDAMVQGVANESQVRFVITDELMLTSLEMSQNEVGNYDATGKDSKGTEYNIQIEQQPGEIQYTWTNSKGKEGTGVFEI